MQTKTRKTICKFETENDWKSLIEIDSKIWKGYDSKILIENNLKIWNRKRLKNFNWNWFENFKGKTIKKKTWKLKMIWKF